MHKKATRPVLFISITRGETPLYAGSLLAFPFNSALIVEKSIAFFQDPEPCFIHRSAVISRLIMELEQLLGGQPEAAFSATQLSPDIAHILGQSGAEWALRLYYK